MRRRTGCPPPAHVGLLRSSGARDLLEMPGPVEIGAEPLRQADQHRIEALDETDGIRLGTVRGKRGQPPLNRLAQLGAKYRAALVAPVVRQPLHSRSRGV